MDLFWLIVVVIVLLLVIRWLDGKLKWAAIKKDFKDNGIF
jgi:uncharacterized membrane protein